MLIKNAKILTMAGRTIENGYLIIGNGKIVEIGSMDEIPMGGFGEEIDAKGSFVLPGFIDAHCHVGMWEDGVGFEGIDGNEMTDPVTPQLRAIDAIYHADRAFVEAREGGVTTVVTGPGSANVLGGQFAAVKTYGRSVDEMVVKEPIAMKAAFGENPKRVYNSKSKMPMTRMATAAMLRETLIKAKNYKTAIDNYNRDSEKNKKPEFDFKLDSLLGVVSGDVIMKAHAHRADDILTAIRIAKEFGIRITLDHCTEGYLIKDILAEEGYPAILGPLLSDRSKIELKNADLKGPGILSKAGVRVAIMTDHPVIPVQYLCLSAAMAAKAGMDEEEALKAITINAAQITGIDNRVGSIECGKDADVVIFNTHPFDLKAKVLYTIISGKIIYKADV
ncbi:MAG TPA: amidohydrolase [Clostridiaceae bacterium]|jgi:imidazolonepropionase-like amidohydrolase|nr:amidohydrolase [Clostridiaceae bacterium]